MYIIILNLLFILIMPFLFIGIINRVKSLWAGRKGPSIFQFFYDFIKLIRKGEVISKTTSFIFSITPSLALSSVLTSSLIVPMVNKVSIFSFSGDFILFFYLLSFSKFFNIISSMDTGSSFEGMGATRELSYSVFLEPILFIIIGTLILLTGNYSFNEIFNKIDNIQGLSFFIIFLFIIILFLVILIEGCRVPIDDPDTHLELTMIHEVMILDNSGPDLAFIQYGNALKMVIFSFLISNLILPKIDNLFLTILFYFAIISIIAILIGIIESLLARVKLIYIPKIIISLFSLAILNLCVIIFFVFRGV